MAIQNRKRTASFIVLGALLLFLLSGVAYLQVVGGDLSNPRGNFWRVVRQGITSYSSTPQQGHTKLIINGGENWRELRNGFLMPLSQWLIALALVAMGAFYLRVGPDKLEKPRSGIKIERYNLRERIIHWYTAALFIVMAITGLSMLLGRIFLIPVFGYWLDSGYLQAAKVLHNYCGPLLLIGFALELIFWVNFNIPAKADLQWFKNMGGMLGHGPRPHTGRVNVGQKGWFWLVIVFGATVGVTGVILDFPIWGQTRFTMQVSHVIHAAVAIAFVTASLGHIYMGTAGVEGVFEGMWKGYVDAVWAQQHADLWYEEKMHGIG